MTNIEGDRSAEFSALDADILVVANITEEFLVLGQLHSRRFHTTQQREYPHTIATNADSTTAQVQSAAVEPWARVQLEEEARRNQCELQFFNLGVILVRAYVAAKTLDCLYVI